MWLSIDHLGPGLLASFLLALIFLILSWGTSLSDPAKAGIRKDLPPPKDPGLLAPKVQQEFENLLAFFPTDDELIKPEAVRTLIIQAHGRISRIAQDHDKGVTQLVEYIRQPPPKS